MIKMVSVAGFPNGYSLNPISARYELLFGLVVFISCRIFCLTSFLSQAGALNCTTTSDPAFLAGFFLAGEKVGNIKICYSRTVCVCAGMVARVEFIAEAYSRFVGKWILG
jgi:hypothetical protein